ncbi:GspH/FimT family pseudopilin [Burkholderia multivorans]|uniref:GspH/FimT family pseudopilin n=1 Tax=Burkholderia multivorans TaxID=87883 RepID=UPI00158BDDDA|nr:GspH/FimT family pseudopilin [Burkholderia multivorans]MBU9430100.1 GspH/FimT family pseudopilin [Burkholderia multivorans]
MERCGQAGMKGGRHVGGFTLVELMVAIAIAAGLGLYAVPVFDQWRMRERVDARARTLLGALSFARAEATRLGVRVTLCRADRNGGCLHAAQRCGSAEWSCDWVVAGELEGALRVLRRYPQDREIAVAGAAQERAFVPPAGQVIGGIRRFELRPRRDVPALDGARLSRCVRLAAGGRARLSTGRCDAA